MERQNPILGRGWAFPMTVGRHGPGLAGGAAKVAQSLYLILFTAPGEAGLRPEFGCGLRDLVFRPNTATFRAQLADRVRAAIDRWEPRVDLIDVLVETSEAAPTLVDLHIAYRLRVTNQVFNQVYPLILSEGEDAAPGGLVRVGAA